MYLPPVIGYCTAGIQHTNNIRALVMAGVNELLFRGIDDAGVALRAVVASAQRASVGDIVTTALNASIPEALAQFVRRVASHPAESQRVAQVAQALGYHRKTLVNHCALAVLPPPQELLAWCRLAVVGHLLGTTMLSVEAISSRLDFPSDTALRNLIKRYVGMRATDVRTNGGLRCVMAALDERLRRHRDGTRQPAASSAS
ncbi:MAG: helix-turn-helix domain-containing protein [bacterium]